MHMKNIKQYSIIIVIILQLLAQQTLANYCTTTKQLSGTRLFTSLQEKHIYYFEDYIKGYNLEYDIDLTDGSSYSKEFTINQGLTRMNTEQDFDDFPIPVDLDHLFVNEEESDSYFAQLATNLNNHYIVRFGEGEKTITPTFLTTITLPENDNMSCFGVVMVNPDKAVVDCALYHPSTQQAWSNLFYIVSKDMKYQEVTVNAMYSEAKPFARKSIRYETSNKLFNQVYIISGIPFDQTENDDLEDEYLNVYRFIDRDETDKNGDPILGEIVVNKPITQEDLKFKEKLRLAEFGVVGKWIYILDNNQGAVFFEFMSNKITALQQPLTTLLPRWGMSVTMFGTTLRMVVAENQYLREYSINSATSIPVLINSYKIEYQNIGTVELQCNTDYIALKQGQYLTIYKRGVTSINYMKVQILDVAAFYLWYSNNLFVAHQETLTNYILQKPYFKISPTKARDSFDIVLIAKSSNFDSSTTCKLSLITEVVDKKTKKAYYSDFPQERQWNLQQSQKTIIPLSIYWVGPNIQYMEDDGKNKCAVSGQSVNSLSSNLKKITEDGDDLLIFINEAQEVEVEFNHGDSKKWVFSKIYASKSLPNQLGQFYYVINQDSSNVLKIFLCREDTDILTQFDCGDPVAQVKLSSRITTASIGKWGIYEEILALSVQDNPSYVSFYFLFTTSGEYQIGDFWFKENIDSIMTNSVSAIVDLELYDNALYSVLEGKSSRFISITSNIEGIKPEGFITIEDAELWNYDTSYWIPQEVVVSEHHPNILFILAPKMVYILNVANHTPQLLSQMKIDTSVNTEIIITENNLVVAQNAEDVKEYSLQNLIYLSSRLEFEYQTFDFEFTSPFLIAHGPKTGLIYILAYESAKVNNLKLLVFQAGTESLRTLVKVIDVEDNCKLEASSSPIISAGGNDEYDYIFLQYNNKQKFFQSPASENVQLVPLKFGNKNIYVDNVQINMLMCDWSGTSKQIEHEVTLVNSQTNIIIYNDIIEKDTGDLYADNQDSASFKANVKEWYNGSVVEMMIVCEEDPEVCNNQIQLKNIVSRDTENEVLQDMNYIYDVQNYDGNLVFLKYDEEKGKQLIGYLSDDGNKEYVYNYLDVDTSSGECTYFMPVYDYDNELINTSFLVICFDYDVSYYYMQQIYEQNNSHSLNESEDDGDEDGDDNNDSGRYYLCELDQEEGVIQRDQYQAFHGGLFVNQKSENPGIYIFNSTDSYTITENKKKINCAGLVNKITHSRFVDPIPAPNFTPTSFFVEYQSITNDQASQQFAKLFVTDSPSGVDPSERRIWFISLDILNSFKPKMDFDSLDFIVYETFVATHDLFVNDETRLKRIKLIDMHEYSTATKDNVIYRVIVMTDNTAMYEMALEFQLDQSDILKQSSFVKSKSEIMNVYNNYGDAYLFDYIEVLGNTLAVAYMNLESYDVTLAMYQLHTETDKLIQDGNRRILSDDSHVPLHTMQGGYVFDLTSTYFDETDPMLSFALFNNPKYEGASLLTTDFSETLSLIQLDFTPHVISIETKGEFEPQTVNVHLLSDYSVYQNSFQLKVNYGSYKEPSSGIPGWAIALIVIGSLLVLAGVAFFIWKWKFAGAQENTGYQYMKQEQSDAGFSLQEPTKA